MARPRETHPDGLLGLSGMAELDRTRWIELLSRLGGRDPDLRQLEVRNWIRHVVLPRVGR